MPRPKMSPEELKLHKQQRNKQYYLNNKEKFKRPEEPSKGVVYVISGLDDGKCYVGVSNHFQSRKHQHRSTFGEVEISPVLTFKDKVDVGCMNYFECLIMYYHIGFDKCINASNKYLPKLPELWMDSIMQHLDLLEEESQEVVRKILNDMDSKKLNVA